jgi:putative ABC transport system permease protein
MLSDLRSTWRALQRAPLSAVAAIGTLALALGVGTTLFALFDRAVLSPALFDDIDKLALIGEVPAAAPSAAPRPLSADTFRAWRTTASHLARFEGYDPTNRTMTGAGHPARVSVTAATPGFLPMLGITPQIGRSFNEQDATTAIVSHAYWRTTLAGDPEVLGTTLTLNGVPFTIIGVLPESFTFALNHSELWIPLAMDAADATPIRVIARLATGTSGAALTTGLEQAADARARGFVIAAVPLRTALHTSAHTALPLLLAAALLCVLLTTINVANLLLLRGMDRAQEYAVRTALGASRLALARHAWIEAALVVSTGALGGALLAIWLTPVASYLAESQLGAATPVATIGWRALGALAGMTFVCVAAAALAPTAAALRWRQSQTITRDSISASSSEVRVRRGFIAVEVTLAFVLLTGLALVGGSLQRLTAVDPGFARNSRMTAQLSLPAVAYPDARSVREFYDTLHHELTTRLGENQVALVDELPLTGDRGRSQFTANVNTATVDAVTRAVGPNYFEVIGIALSRGRGFTPLDTHNAPPRIVVSRSFALNMFGDDDVVGRRVGRDGTPASLEIIGVVSDVKHRSLDERDIPTVYFSASQQPSRSMHLVVRDGRSLRALEAIDIIRAEVARRDAALPLYAVRSLEEVVTASPGVPLRRIVSASFSAFAVLSLTIATVGVFAAIGHDVRRRRREIALRFALGAHPARMRRDVIAAALALLTPGLVLGVLMSIALARSLQPILFGVTPVDVASLLFVGIVLTASTLLASAVPARQAGQSDPAQLLRGE